MKIKNPNAGALTNFEVIDFLKSRGASKDASRVLAPIAASEYKVYDYLVATPACNQTREHIKEFMERCEPYKLAKAEILNIINIRPSEQSEIYTHLEQADARFEESQRDEILKLVDQVLPPHPAKPEPESGVESSEQQIEPEPESGVESSEQQIEPEPESGVESSEQQIEPEPESGAATASC